MTFSYAMANQRFFLQLLQVRGGVGGAKIRRKMLKEARFSRSFQKNLSKNFVIATKSNYLIDLRFSVTIVQK